MSFPVRELANPILHKYGFDLHDGLAKPLQTLLLDVIDTTFGDDIAALPVVAAVRGMTMNRPLPTRPRG